MPRSYLIDRFLQTPSDLDDFLDIYWRRKEQNVGGGGQTSTL